MSEKEKRNIIDEEEIKEISDVENSKQEKEKEIDVNKSEKTIILKAEAYKTIILYCSRYANNAISKENWKEIYGILIGYTDDDFVYVEKAEALTYGHATDVQLDQSHYVFITEIQDKLDKEKQGYYMVGWFHSHPGLGLFFSDIDILNQLGFQTNNPDFCGLVFDHTLLGKKKEEKILSDEGTEHSITKYDTGFEIYRIKNVNLDVNSEDFSENFYRIDYIVDGLNKYFFANVLSELSALVTEGKPLQSAYREEFSSEKKIETPSKPNNTINKEILTEIPMKEDVAFGVNDFFYSDVEGKKKQKQIKLKEIAEQLIYEGNQAFKNKDSFIGVEKFRQGIDKYKEIKDFERILELLRIVAQKCISNEHFIFAEEFSDDLYKLAKKQNNLFYLGISHYISGYLLLKKGDNDVLESALNKVQEAAINFEKEGDYAGAGMCFNKIGSIYQSRLNKIENACLFYRAAIENFNKAILKMHPLRTDFWNKPDLLLQKIVELRDIVEELLPKLENKELKSKIENDLKKLHYNF
ncbi:MAG: hypothetical protein ACFFC3_12140 [Candidatus Odinarchaeota archaeon]